MVSDFRFAGSDKLDHRPAQTPRMLTLPFTTNQMLQIKQWKTCSVTALLVVV